MRRASFLTVLRFLSLVCVLAVLAGLWFRGGFAAVYLDTDLGRDLSELSNIWQHKVVWLGPRLSVGFPASPIYYYVFFPALWLAKGNANALVVANILLALTSLGIFGWLSLKKFGKMALLAVAFLGLLPWAGITAVHPGNGYTYVWWLFLGLSCLWFEAPLALSGLLIGLALAHHPVVVFVLPILIYEWWRRGHKLKQLLLIGLGFALPWAPIIAFEVITKGYLTREWLAHPGGELHWQLHAENLGNLFSLFRLGTVSGSIVCFVSTMFAKQRLKLWWLLGLLPALFLCCISLLPLHYLFGVAAVLSFLIVLLIFHHKWLMPAFLFFICILAWGHFQANPVAAQRSIPKMSHLVHTLSNSSLLKKEAKIAVVAAISPKTEVPQADDYRFFLRMNGYSVLEPQHYSEADTLLMLIEVPDFDWQHWSNWEIEQADAKKLGSVSQSDGIQVVIFEK